MKKILLKPLGIMTLASFTFYGCASSNDNGTTAMEGTTMSETTTMAGSTTDDNSVDAVVVEEQVVVPVATLSITMLPMENTEEVDKMFESIDDTEQYSAIDLLRTSPNLTTFVKLIEQADMVDDMERLNEMTVFAPTNEAFAKIPKEKLESLILPENKALLMRMLQAHIIPSEVTETQLETNTRIRMSENSYIPVDKEMAGTVTRVGGAELVKTDIETSNGRVHIIDGVILPSEDAREDDIR